MARKTKEDAELTYHALLDAATALFIRQGIARTTLNNIALEAGMTRGAIYWHFDNKDAVIQALWERNTNALHTSFINELRKLDANDPAGHFRKTIYNLLQNVVERPEIGAVIRIVMLSVEFTDEQTELQRFLNSKYDEIDSTVGDALTRLHEHNDLLSPLPPKLIGQGLMSYLLGLIHVYLKPGQTRLDLKQDGEQLLNLFLDTILVS